MGRTGGMIVGLIGGLALAGVVVGLLIPLAPETWRSRPLTGLLAVAVVALCGAAGYIFSRPAPE